MRDVAVSAHRVTDEPAALTPRQRAVVAIDVRDEIARDELLEVARRHGARVHRPVVHCLGIGQYDDRFPAAGGECAFDRLRDVDLARPLFGADRIAVQGINHRIAAFAFSRIAWRQKDEHVAIDGIAFEVSDERRSMNLDPFERRGAGAVHGRRKFRRQLRGGRLPEETGGKNREQETQVPGHRRSSRQKKYSSSEHGSLSGL